MEPQRRQFSYFGGRDQARHADERAKTDKERMHAQHGRNYAFFDAPVGLIFTIDRVLRQGSWLDYGMFLQSVMVAARGQLYMSASSPNDSPWLYVLTLKGSWSLLLRT